MKVPRNIITAVATIVSFVVGLAARADPFELKKRVTPLDSARAEVNLLFGESDVWWQSLGCFNVSDGLWHAVEDVPEERILEGLTGVRLDSVVQIDLDAWDAFVKKYGSIPLSFSCEDAETGIRYLFSSGIITDAADRYVYKIDVVHKWRGSHGPFVCLRPAREWNGLRAEYVFVEKSFMTRALAEDDMQAMCDELASRCPSLKVEKVSQGKMRVRGARFRASLHVFSERGVHSVSVSFYNHVPRKEFDAWSFRSQTPYIGSVVMESPCLCSCARRDPKRWFRQCRAVVKNASLDELAASRVQETNDRSIRADNFAFLKKELPVPSLEWGDPNGDEKAMEKKYAAISRKRHMDEMEQLRQMYSRKDAEERAQWKAKEQQRRTQEQLAQVESNKVAFARGDVEAAMRVSYYYTAYALKLEENGKGKEAVRAAQESLLWTRKAADAGSVKGQSALGRWLLEGGTGCHMFIALWSGLVPKVPKDGPYVSPINLQGLSLPPDILLCETNGVKTYFRVYRRDPVQGVRYMELASKGGDLIANSWISVRKAKNLPLWLPEWWLRKDGFRVAGREVASEEEIVTRLGLRIVCPVKRKLGRDAEGRVVFVSDEYFSDAQYADWYKNPWHDANDTCVVLEVLP